MIIANPIYDVVFKYLLEDGEIARGLLSAILGEEVLSLDFKPQETSAETTGSVSILRFDFKAVLRTREGGRKKVLIELQKAKQMLDVMRFRRYLGENYRREDEVSDEEGRMEKIPLPIITIYFLGFVLENIPQPVVKVNREYRDVITQEVIEVKEDFVELLTHDSYLIQLKRLEGRARTQLERVLELFNPDHATEDPHQLQYLGQAEDPLLRRMLERLGRAIASDEIRAHMDLEDEIERIFQREIRKALAEKSQQLEEEQARVESERQRAEAERERAESERLRADAERERAEAERLRADALQQQLDALRRQQGEAD
jgi:hypothetical protein